MRSSSLFVLAHLLLVLGSHQAVAAATSSTGTWVAVCRSPHEMPHLRSGRSLPILLKAAAANPHGAAYSAQARWRLRASRISFINDETRLLETASTLERVYSAYPEFAGIGLHGIFWTSESRTP